MQFTVSDGRLLQDGRPVKFVQANAFGRAISKPLAIVLHDTAAHKPGSSVNWFASKGCKSASAHFVIERDGSIVQMVDLRRTAYHAGKSALDGKGKGNASCNSTTIGIEIMSPGMMRRVGDEAQLIYDGGKIVARFPIEDCRSVSTKEHGDGWCLPYTQAQIDAVNGICRALVAAYPSIRQVLTHWLVSPRRKVDTTPLWPLEETRRLTFAPGAKPVKGPPPPLPVAAAPVPQPPAQPPVVMADEPLLTPNETRVALAGAMGLGGAGQAAAPAQPPAAPIEQAPMAQLKEAADNAGIIQTLGDALAGIGTTVAANPWLWGAIVFGGGYGGLYLWRRRKRRLAALQAAGAVRAAAPQDAGDGVVAMVGTLP